MKNRRIRITIRSTTRGVIWVGEFRGGVRGTTDGGIRSCAVHPPIPLRQNDVLSRGHVGRGIESQSLFTAGR
jgi:hypothetical protein